MAKREREEPTPGFVIVDKPAGWTSHDVVGKMRRVANTRKVGHAGTLDPMATGVLVIGVGKATKLLTFVVGADKDYDATIRLGVATVTEDAEGEPTGHVDAGGVTRAQIDDAVAALTGDIMQTPSAVSAIKIDGKRAYKRVREGEDVHIPARPVTVSRFEVLDVRAAKVPEAATADGTMLPPIAAFDVEVSVTVSSGTYVRALARDLGDAVGVGGHLTALRRTRVGGYGIDQASTLQALQDGAAAGEPVPLLPLAESARAILPARELTEREVRTLGFGQFIELTAADGSPTPESPLAGFAPDGTLAALLVVQRAQLKPLIVFAPSEAQASVSPPEGEGS